MEYIGWWVAGAGVVSVVMIMGPIFIIRLLNKRTKKINNGS